MYCSLFVARFQYIQQVCMNKGNSNPSSPPFSCYIMKSEGSFSVKSATVGKVTFVFNIGLNKST